MTERATAYASRVNTGTYLSVRFGNVLSSRGSVLTAFPAQIAAAGPITVTDPEVTRYFTTVPPSGVTGRRSSGTCRPVRS